MVILLTYEKVCVIIASINHFLEEIMEQTKQGKAGKTKLIISIILFFLAFIPLIFSIICFANIPKYSGREEGNLIGNGIFFLVLTEVIMLVSGILNWTYRKKLENPDKLSKVFFIINIITVIPLAAAIAIICVIIFICRKIYENAPPPSSSNSSSSSPENKTYIITNDLGCTEKLKWDQYTQTYRDSNGKQYKTNDNGKTFRRL